MSVAFVPDADWLDWDHHPSRPTFVLPPGSVDAHCHVFGPGDVFPYAPERRYTPTDAPKEQLFALRDFLGFERNVIVQATCHGSDNSALVDALMASNDRARGVATITPDIAEEELKLLHEAGVRAVRFNYVKRLGDTEPDEYYQRIVERIAPLGWHVVVYFEAADLAERWDFFTHLETTVVVDHMGRPDVTKDPDGPEFGQFLRLMDEHPERLVQGDVSRPTLRRRYRPTTTSCPSLARVVERYPDRVLTGTDWPHPNLKTHMPDDGGLVDFIPRIATTPELQRQLLVDNPLTLYWREDTVNDNPEFDDIPGTIVFTAHTVAQRVLPQSVLHESHEARKPRTISSRRARLPRRVADDRSAESRACSPATTTPCWKKAATSTFWPRSLAPTALASKTPPRR